MGGRGGAGGVTEQRKQRPSFCKQVYFIFSFILENKITSSLLYFTRVRTVT